MTEKRSIVVGTAGHIDHGKTTLIKALTGVNTDRLGEEQKRGITIELGFAPLDIGDLHIGFVDVPGHEKFVKHMLAGAGGIDAVLLVVAADESVMPQTREHVEICRLLGLNRAVAAVTKADVADKESIELVSLETQELLEDNGFTDVEIVPVSGQTGDGLEELQQALLQMAQSVSERQYEAQPRLPIDRVFTIKGHGTVVTGTLISGRLRQGDKLTCYPSRKETSIKSLQVHGESSSEVMAGHRVAINLANIATDEIDRGQTLAPSEAMLVSRTWDVDCSVLESAPCNLEHNMRVRIHAGSAEMLARISINDSKPLKPGESGIVRLRFEEDAAAYIGDRIVIRWYSPMITLAGAVVLDNAPPLFATRRKQVFDQLNSLPRTNLEEIFAAAIELLPRPVSMQHLIQRFGFSKDRTVVLMNELIGKGTALQVAESPPEYCSISFMTVVKQAITSALAKLHQELPLKPGFSRNSIRATLPRQTSESVYKTALRMLSDEALIVQAGGDISLSSHQITLSEDQETAIAAIEKQFEDSGFAPPSPAEAITRSKIDEGKALFDLLIARGTVKLIADDFFLHQKTLDSLVGVLRNKAGGNSFSVPEFKKWLGISRKYAIPLLEYLDRQSITYRKGDDRFLSA